MGLSETRSPNASGMKSTSGLGMAMFTKHKPKNFIARNIIKQGGTNKQTLQEDPLVLPIIEENNSQIYEKNENRRSRTLMVGGGRGNSPSELSAARSKSRSPSAGAGTTSDAQTGVVNPESPKKEGWHQRQIRI